MDSEEPTLFGLVLSTHRDKELGPEALAYFQFEAAIAAIAVFFFRTTVCFPTEPKSLMYFFSVLLAFLAYSKKSYELIIAVELFSYAIPYLLFVVKSSKKEGASKRELLPRWLLSIAVGAILSSLMAHIAVRYIFRILSFITPRLVLRALESLFPIQEMKAAYNIMESFAHPMVLQKQICHLLFVTFHIQVGMGFLGIDFLRKEQDRRNQLVRMDVESKGSSNGGDKQECILERARRFQRGAAPFILFTALPYMFQIIMYGNVNKFAFTCVQHDMHRVIRLNELFDHDNHLIAMANDSPTSPEAYATSMNNVLDTAYDIFNRKLFSLPKIMLLPSVMSRQPMLVAQVFPIIFISDWLKASVMSFLTVRIEDLQKQLQDIKAVRTKVESYDMKNAELLQRSGKGATQFTQRRWEELTVKVQIRMVVSDLLSRSKGFFSFIQRNFVFSVLIDCALAHLIAVGKIASADTFVFSRAIEDAVDMVLMRSRGEAELARMMTEIDKLQKLADLWDRSKDRSLLHCKLAPPTDKALILRNLVYSRGTAHVRADHVELRPGVYALTGSNGSGKSTLFRVLMSCNTNEKSVDLPASINLLTPFEPLAEEDDLLREVACEADSADEADEDCEVDVDMDGQILSKDRILADGSIVPVGLHHPKLSITMPSSDVVEISQSFYWPLYSRPIDWIYQEHVLETCSEAQLEEKTRRVAEELMALEFFQAATVAITNDNETKADANEENVVEKIVSDLLEEKEDWFADLSGGQKSKVELVRKVFLHEHCPDVLLVDETMAPLDPASKSLVMAKLKAFCRDSIIIVIYHTDVAAGRTNETEGRAIECVPSNDFFDKNIHLEKGIVNVRETC